MRFAKMLCAAALAAAVSSVPASAKDYKIGYSVFWGTNPFLVTMVNGAKKAAEDFGAFASELVEVAGFDDVCGSALAESAGL